MKYKITRKLVGYFAFTLLLFAIIVGFTFSNMFKQSTLDQSRIDLEFRAKTIANSVAPYLEDTTSSKRHSSMMRNRDLNAYLKSLEAATVGEVWVVDKEMKSISKGHGHTSDTAIQLSDFPIDSEQLITQALAGVTVYSDGFSDMLKSNSVTVGVPIFNQDSQTLGAVLVHAPIAGIDAVIQHGYHVLMINILVALLLSVGVAYFLSRRFIKPLNRINDTAKSLALENYHVKTNIHQNDEIGTLATSIDTLAIRLNESEQARIRLDHMRHEFFADISHELKTPVTILRGSLEAILDGSLDESKRETYEMDMLHEITHLQKLINDLLDFSKLNATDFNLDKEMVNLHDIVHDAMRSLRPIASQKGIIMDYCTETIPYAVYGDYARLRQMITFILDNAIKFSYPNSIVYLKQEGELLSVTDSGQGIKAEALKSIFNRFYKDGGNHNDLGNGIGLAIAQQIAHRHKIDIIVESIPDKETSFTFVLTHNRQEIDNGN